jgi:hypothetical protein
MSLKRDGFVVVRDVLDRPMLADLRRRTAALLAAATADHRRRQRATGSLIHIAADPGFARLIAWPKALEALAEVGLGGARFSSGYVISKPADGPRSSGTRTGGAGIIPAAIAGPSSRSS